MSECEALASEVLDPILNHGLHNILSLIFIFIGVLLNVVLTADI